jgi:signal transduction histidine kinase
MVGVMFINYRRQHEFDVGEKSLIQALASAAAIAINNARILEAFHEVDSEIAKAVDVADVYNRVFTFIVSQAMVITGADVAEIHTIEPFSREMTLQARCPAGEVAGKPIRDKVTKKVRDTQKSLLAADGSALCVPLRDGKRAVLGVLCVKSNRKAFTERHQGLLEHLADSAVLAIQKANTQKRVAASESHRTFGDLASNLIHQSGDPLLAIDHHAALLENSPELPKVVKRSAAEIRSQVEAFRTQIDLLPHSVEKGEPGPVEVRQVLQEALGKLPPAIQADIRCPPDLPLVMASKKQLEYVFDNLARNAAEAMKESGRLTVKASSARPWRDWVRVEVVDNGPGIPPRLLPNIFKPGYTSKSSDANLGFGLSWVRNYLESIGGMIDVKSRPGRTCFSVTLPVAETRTTETRPPRRP